MAEPVPDFEVYDSDFTMPIRILLDRTERGDSLMTRVLLDGEVAIFERTPELQRQQDTIDAQLRGTA
ncbi:MAG: hypothetical protein JWM81_150 [Candidatus Saccharibacteria bacterium]|nr:hypothetical protein [Candidatus Saccharibacteria bacterium]